MVQVVLGSTGIVTCKNALGCLPLQRDSKEDAVKLIRNAYQNGFTFFDTARAYSDSEEKLGEALHNVRDKIYIATKTMSTTAQGFWSDLETSLKTLRTTYVDIYQFHNPPFCPRPNDGTGLYEAMLEAKAQGKIRHIGFTNHALKLALEAVESGLYETLQFPFSYLADSKECELVGLCKKRSVGFIAMKSLAGGLITNSAAAFAFAAQYENVLPIWGIQRQTELDEFISLQKNPPAMTEQLAAVIAADRTALAGSFCRGCGYCMPCPKQIEINNCARMSLLLRRAPSAAWLGEAWQKKMALIPTCIHCNACASRCPYGLDTPTLLAQNYADYTEVLAGRRKV